MDAYKLLKTLPTSKINENKFGELKQYFKDNFLLEIDYYQRKEKHREPAGVIAETLEIIYKRLREIGERSEMRDHDEQKRALGYVSTKIKEIWKADKNLKSHYSAISEYCQLRSKDFNTITVHFAEYEAFDELCSELKSLQENSTEIKPKVAKYHLFVTSDKNDWEGEAFTLPIGRFWSSKEITEQYGQQAITDIEELKEWPCVFAYESQCNKAPKIGRLTNIVLGSNLIGIEYEITNELPLDDFNRLLVSFGILDKLDMKTTHWEVKSINLFQVLERLQLPFESNKSINGTVAPIVFISYCWDDELHNEWVLGLANRLRKNGVDVLFDRYELVLGRSLNHFIDDALKRSARILMVLTPKYKLRADNRTGGVGYEYSVINSALYQDIVANNKIIPVLRKGTDKDSIPDFMRQYIHLDMREDSIFDSKYDELLRTIFEVPKVPKPKLGTRPKFD